MQNSSFVKLKKISVKFLEKSIAYLKRFANKLENNTDDTFSKNVKKWFADDGDKTHRLNYDLNEHSVVFDLGGYEGQWTSDIYSKYNCTIYVFEVLYEFHETIKTRFIKNQKIKIFPFGLANANKKEKISVMDNETSLYRESNISKEIKLVEAARFIEENNITKIDLMKINIEGGEFDLLNHLIETKQIEKIVNIQVQFHDIIPDAESRMLKIQKSLANTHQLTYQYKFVWENWELKQSGSKIEE